MFQIEKNEQNEKKIAVKILESLMWEYRPYFKKFSAEGYLDAFSSFDTAHILSIILAEAKWNHENGLGYYVEKGAGEISNRIFKILGPGAVRKRLMILARYWFISLDSSRIKYTPDGRKHRDRYLISPNPALYTIFDLHQSRARKSFIKSSVSIGDNRELGEQGYHFTVKFGYPEHESFKIEDLNYGSNNPKDFEEKVSQKDEKAAENKLWRGYNEKFIACAANLWVWARSRSGFGQDVPLWSARSTDLSSEARKQRNELTKTFAALGGAVTALAWYIYTAGIPEADKNGKLIFDLKIPHRQFKGSDMKPSGFSKHINAILADEDFKRLATDMWHTEGKKRLLEYFSREILEIGPRDGSAYSSKLGYVFGQKNLPKIPKTNEKENI